jgi:apolipoprotein N-acyltransferase
MTSQLPESQDRRRWWIASAAASMLLWVSQPPVNFWPAALVAAVPWLCLAASRGATCKRNYASLWLCSSAYWLLTLQGLRLAHPWMFIPWITLSLYLAVYPVCFVAILRRLGNHPLPLVITAPVVWVGLEWVRNHLFTGISVLMLGHHVVDIPQLIQIADLGGTYAVSFVVMMVNVAVWTLAVAASRRQAPRSVLLTVLATASVVLATALYGQYRLRQPIGKPLATFALIQRSESIEYDLSKARAIEIFSGYVQQSVLAAQSADRPIDVVVWPESMFTASTPWLFVADPVTVPAEFEGSREEFLHLIGANQNHVIERARYLQNAVATAAVTSRRPQLLVGSSVVRYGARVDAFCGLIHFAADGSVLDWYGKTHLVMFGEYVPLLSRIPGLRSLVPAGMGVTPGAGAKRMLVNQTAVAGNICIETAVERVAINHLGSFADDQIPDVLVTITNDGWYDDSSVIDHHLVCARMVAVGSRRPILSAANSGPTAWIDSTGGVVEQLPKATNGGLIATPRQDPRISLYLRIGDWPARLCAIATCGLLWSTWLRRRQTPDQK